jgi:archaemetzincin
MKILIIPMGSVDPDILKAISTSLEKTFHCLVETGSEMPIPQDSYDNRRKQYHSTTMLKALRGIKQGNFGRMLGVTDVDLYVPKLNFVFGEADLLSGAAVISLTRLRQEFYGLPPDGKLFYERAVKEAVHELGHTYGLGHCQNPACIMFFSNSLVDTDKKGPGFCTNCNKALNR